jgi:galactokinase/galacturonokinase
MCLPIVPVRDDELLLADLKRSFQQQFGEAEGKLCFLVSVPLRVCPLGAHSDHQGGLVSGFTIDRSMQLLAQPIEAARASVYSEHGRSLRSFDQRR